MNFKIIRPKHETEDLLLSISKNCQMLIEQTHTKPQETLEFKMIKSRETFRSNPPVEVKENWMFWFVDLEVYNSLFNIKEENNRFELYKFPGEESGGVSDEKVRDEIEKDLDSSDITNTALQDDIIGPIFIEEYKEKVSKRMEDEQCMRILSIYTSSVFQDFESFLWTQIDLVEDDVRMVLDEYKSSFITYKITPGIYTFKDLSKALFTFLFSPTRISRI